MKINFSSYKSLLKITGLFTGVQGLSLVLNIVRGKIAAMLLGPGGKGLNDMYNETRELIHTTTNCGLDIAGVRGVSQKYELWCKETDYKKRQLMGAEIDEQIKLLRTWVIIFAVFGSVLCMLLAEPISYFTFSDYDHVGGILLLSPAIGFSTMVCGEMTVLKATRRIKAIATLSIVNVVLAILVTLPFYQYWGLRGIVPALVILSIVQFIAISSYSYRYNKPHFLFSRLFLKQGTPMMKVGLAFTITNIVSHGTMLYIKSFINRTAGGGDLGIAEVGLFGAGYSIAFSYAGLIFASLDNDYYPRLAGVFDNLEERRKTVWKQVRLLVSLAIPVATLIIVFLPWILPLLNTDEFMGAVRMAQYATVGLIFRAAYLPMAYIPLAAGHSRVFMYLEFISYIFLFLSVYTGYNMAGLDGAGIGLTVSIFLDMCVVYVISKVKYKL